jgi:hypothetical protein
MYFQTFSLFVCVAMCQGDEFYIVFILDVCTSSIIIRLNIKIPVNPVLIPVWIGDNGVCTY